MNARERILGGLRAASRDGLPRAEAPAPPAAPPRQPERQLERFAEELARLGGRLHQPASARAACERVLELAGSRGPRPVLSWAPDALPLAGLWSELAAAGLEPLQADLPAEPAARVARLERLAEAATGVTGADAALAETGALLLASGPGRSRLAWLLPERHVALLSRSALAEDLAALVRERPECFDAGAGVALVAGPSRTADIELTLTRGVHGPRELDVVLLGPW